MTPERLAEIRTRERRATDEPWIAQKVWDTFQVRHESTNADFEICEMATFEPANGEFIAHARQDIPDLLNYIEILAAREIENYAKFQETLLSNQQHHLDELERQTSEQHKRILELEADLRTERANNDLLQEQLLRNAGLSPEEVQSLWGSR
jgi:predicted RNase H-like nuclease (RuvC/YqgF family)